MKTRTILLGSAAVALAASVALPAQAARWNGWYLGLEAGASWAQDWDFTSATTFLTPHTHSDTASFETGFALFATVGYAIGDWRLELEGGYRDNDMDTVRTTGFTGPGGFPGDFMREISVMANVHYDIPLGKRFMFSLGAGAGGDNVNIEFNGNPAADIDDWRFAYQGIAGFSYALSSRTDLTLNYRYLHVDAPDLNVGPFFSHTLTGTEDIQKHAVTLGIRFALSPERELEPAPPPPPPPPPPPEPPPPPPPPKSFVVFFGFNKCNITPEADRVLGDAAMVAKDTGSAHISIVGHTDTSGKPRYNQRLSECRAKAAGKNLEEKGIPAGAISVSGKGETELMVQTGDGVKEPQNRRATVDLE